MPRVAKAVLKGNEVIIWCYLHWQFQHRPHYHAPVLITLQILLKDIGTTCYFCQVLEGVTTL